MDLKPLLPKQTLAQSTGVKTALLFGVLALIGVWIATTDLRPDLSHMNVTVLSGSEKGNYYAIVEELKAEAGNRHGKLVNVATRGSVENVERLAATCDAHYALVQDGLSWPTGGSLELVGQLRKSESVFFLGKNADKITSFADFRGLSIGVGPIGSGTDRIARQILDSRGFAGLGTRPSNHPIDEQLALAEKGALDLAVLVIDEDAALVDQAIRERGLQIANLSHADVVARRLPFVRTGRIGAGHYDPVRMLPPKNKTVLQVDTLVVGNGCASRSETMGLLTLLSVVFPDFVRFNKETPNATGLPLAGTSRNFMENDGPEFLGEYFPWIVDIMPTSNWVHILFGVSILFNIMSFWHRFRLWRVDANRVKAELCLPMLFGAGVTRSEVATMTPEHKHRTPEAGHQLETLIDTVDKMITRCRQQSLSVLVSMGHEMAYRYQEEQMAHLVAGLRAFRAKLK